MLIKVDVREKDLILQINILTSTIPLFKDLVIKTETLPIGDIIIFNEETNSSELYIERKSISDLLASIKDGRYEEQSYRLNGLNHHNHNVIYLIEGDVNKVNRFKESNHMEKLTIYSAIFSLNYYKGFSVIRTFNMEETAIFLCNSLAKLNKERNKKNPFYKNVKDILDTRVMPVIQNIQQNIQQTDEKKQEDGVKQEHEVKQEHVVKQENSDEEKIQSDKDYISVVKKVKKENITPDNIGEIMLCQIPGISSITAIAIMKEYNTISDLLSELKANPECLKNISYTNSKGQIRKINKSTGFSISKYLLK